MGFDAKSFRSFAAQVQQKMEEIFPGVLELNGLLLEVASYGGALTGEREPGGFVNELEQLVRLRKELHPIMPALGIRGRLNGKDVRLVSVDDRSWEDSWSLRLELLR